MSEVDTPPCPVGDLESIPSEQDVNESLQNMMFALGVTVKPRALPSLPVDGFSESPWKNDYGFSWRPQEEQTFYSQWSMGCGEADAFGSEMQAALVLKDPSMDVGGNTCAKPCPLDRTGSELERSFSSEVTNDAPAAQMNLPCTKPYDTEAEGIRETCLENSGVGGWDEVVNLVQELSEKYGDTDWAPKTGAENVKQRCDKMGGQLRPTCGMPPDEIVRTISVIQRNMETIKNCVPKIAKHKPRFTVLIHRQCTAAVGAVRLISSLARAVSTIVPDIQRQVEDLSESFQSADLKKDSSDENLAVSADSQVSSVLREEGGVATCASMDSLMPTLAALTNSPATIMLVDSSLDEFSSASDLNNLEASGSIELEGETEKECASSLVADLLGPCDHITTAEGFLPPSTPSGAPFRLEWGNDLEEAIRNDSVSELKKFEVLPLTKFEVLPLTKFEVLPLTKFEVLPLKKFEVLPLKKFEVLPLKKFEVLPLKKFEVLPLESAGDISPSGDLLSDEDPNLGGSSAAAAQDESDECDNRGDELPLGSFTLMEIDDLEILTEQTHYCNICSKGFKRDANLRMHMRSHGGKYKSSTSLNRLEKAPKVVQEMVGGKPTRYSCPYVGCSRNMKHPKFQALKTMLCLKNHYRRSHCPKTLKCNICKSKQFSVVADLKTHEKHCGSDKWACSCGTTFSRKEKLYGHVGLFVGHVPVDASAAANVASEVGTTASTLPSKLSNGDIEGLDLWQDW